MTVDILKNKYDTQATIYCTVVDWSLGPMFTGTDTLTASEVAQSFLDWLPCDPRSLDPADLERKVNEFLSTMEDKN